MEVIINKKKTRSENSDRISNLPDSLLIDILALLDPRDAAQTCILSKRWYNLWAFVPSLSFDMEKFKGKADNFNNFVSSFLRLRDKASDVHKFALRYAVPLDTKFSDLVIWAWIMYASEHKVKNLVVHLFGWPCHFLSNKSRFHCDTLENLHLCGIVLMEADDLCLPKLKTLSLIDVTAHGESIQKLLSGCPALITLIMCYSTMYTSSISFGSIKSLTIECCTLGGSLISRLLVLNLEFVEGKGARVITFNNMFRVTKAINRGAW
ncbi:hypothetical protein LUZ63_012190 [Rhynchospora breviuscula]|uniref:F-box domain-containing protein n=1 Tax=Rhynchospora breviuscula TaxID=2022672 RepID=A0A9Q0CK70_9POAL|nr:hypothetical protein LUZ63_012190 [Rhynchospora breviuscula]